MSYGCYFTAEQLEDQLYEQAMEQQTAMEMDAENRILKKQLSDIQDKFDKVMVFIDTLKNALDDTQEDTVVVSRELIHAVIESITNTVKN
jgi:hypothetical protein